MNADHQNSRRSLSEAVQEPRPKPALGPPHDAYAAVSVALLFAASLFFSGRVRAESDWIGWVGVLGSLLFLIAAVHYFQRAYGFRSRGWGRAPMGSVMATYFAVMLTFQFVGPAVYNQFADESVFGLALSCLAVAVLVVGPLRAALGRAHSASQ